MREVMWGCKVCGKRMLTDGNPLTYRTCDACKAKQRHDSIRRLAAKRKAERHADKAEMDGPRCANCGEPIEGAARLTVPHKQNWWVKGYVEPQWARKFCGNACRQAAFRAKARRAAHESEP
jgi:hypothetical protein